MAALDILQILKRFKEAGFDEPQAEVLTTVFRDLRQTDLSLVATKTWGPSRNDRRLQRQSQSLDLPLCRYVADRDHEMSCPSVLEASAHP